MKWQCALLQRWLPEYPDGDLPAFWKNRLRSHLEHCPECREELAALQEVVAAIKATPVAEPEPQFWTEFSRELHLKLARAAHDPEAAPPAPARTWWSRLPYLLGGPALAVLALWVISTYTNQERTGLAPRPQLVQKQGRSQGTVAERADQALREPAPPVAAAPKAEKGKLSEEAKAAPPARPAEAFTRASLDANGYWPEEDLDISTWDLDSELAGMTDREKETFLKKLHRQEKDGSCLEEFSSTYCA